MKISITLSEVTEGECYAGTFDFGGNRFTYTILFKIPLDRVHDVMESKDNPTFKWQQEQFPITVMHVERVILHLSPEEHNFLLIHISQLALMCYRYRQNKALKSVYEIPQTWFLSQAERDDPHYTDLFDMPDRDVPNRLRPGPLD